MERVIELSGQVTGISGREDLRWSQYWRTPGSVTQLGLRRGSDRTGVYRVYSRGGY